MGGGGYIYAANRYGQVLKVDATSNNHTLIGNKIYSGAGEGWGHPTIGADKCIYWPPLHANRTLKFNTNTQIPSLVGDDLGKGPAKWHGGALATNGFIYCIPCNAKHVLQIDARPVKMKHHKSTVGGTDDSPKFAPDRLGYHIYAEGLCKVVQSVENPLASVCVALFGTWGSGKSFLWRLNMAELENKNGWEALTDEIKKELDDLLATTLDRCWVLAFAAWCWVARNLVRLFCCCSAPTLKEEELVATMMILSVPIGLPVWIVVFSVSMLVLFAKHMFVKTRILLHAPFRGVGVKYYGNPDAIYTYFWELFFGKQLKKKDNDVVIPDDLIRLLCCLCRTCCDDEENQRKHDPQEIKWSDVRDVLFRGADLCSGRDLNDISCLGHLQIGFLTSFQTVYKAVSVSASSFKHLFSADYEIKESMTKYIFVEFNVSERRKAT